MEMEKEKEKEPPPPLPHATATVTTTTYNHVLANLESLLLKCTIDATPAESLTPPFKTFIEKLLQDFFPTVHAPDHPPYAWMIENAIKQLNEEEGSTEEAISKFILLEYKKLPWAHAALLKHNLRKLSEFGVLIESNNGCYTICVARFHGIRTSKPNLVSTCTTSSRLGPRPRPIPIYIPSPSPTPSPISSSCSSPTYESSSTSSWEKQRKKRNERKRAWRKKAKGKKIYPARREGLAVGRGRGRGRGRGKGRGRGRGRHRNNDNPYEENMIKEVYSSQVEDELSWHHVDAIETQKIVIEDDEADENIRGEDQPQERGDQDYVDAERRAHENIVIEVESMEHEYRANREKIVDNSSTSTIPQLHRRKLVSEQGRKRVQEPKRSIHPRQTAQRGRGRPTKREMQNKETGKNMEPLEAKMMKREALYVDRGKQHEGASLDKLVEEVYLEQHEGRLRDEPIGKVCSEEEEGDSLDQLIEEVYLELTEATETEQELDELDCTIIRDIRGQESIFGLDTIGMKQKSLASGDNSSRFGTTPWSRRCEESERMAIVHVGDNIQGYEMHRKLSSHSTKFQPRQTEEQIGLPSLHRSSDSSQIRKLRPRPPRTLSTNSSLSPSPVIRKQQEVATRRSLRFQ